MLDWCDRAEAEIETWENVADAGITPGARRMVEEALAFYRSAVTESRA